MPRKGGLFFVNTIVHEREFDEQVEFGSTWLPDTSDLAVLYEWIGRELELRNNRASDLVSTKPSKAYRKLKAPLVKPRGSVVPLTPVQASQGLLNAENGQCDIAPWEESHV